MYAQMLVVSGSKKCSLSERKKSVPARSPEQSVVAADVARNQLTANLDSSRSFQSHGIRHDNLPAMSPFAITSHLGANAHSTVLRGRNSVSRVRIAGEGEDLHTFRDDNELISVHRGRRIGLIAGDPTKECHECVAGKMIDPNGVTNCD